MGKIEVETIKSPWREFDDDEVYNYIGEEILWRSKETGVKFVKIFYAYETIDTCDRYVWMAIPEYVP